MLLKKLPKIIFFILLINIIGSCKKIEENELEFIYLNALDFYVQGDFHKSKMESSLIYEKNKNFIQAALLLAKSHFFLEEYDEAERILSNLYKKNFEYTESKIWYIRTLIFSKKYDVAKQVLDKELTLNQSDWRIYYLYSLVAEYEKDYEVQLSMLNRADMSLSDGVKVYNKIALIWNDIGLTERALEFSEKAKILEN